MIKLIANVRFRGVPEPPFSILFINPPPDVLPFLEEGRFTEFIVTKFRYMGGEDEMFALKLLGIPNPVLTTSTNMIINLEPPVQGAVPAVLAGEPSRWIWQPWSKALREPQGYTSGCLDTDRINFKPLLPE